MRKNETCTSWVVYKMTIHGKAVGVSAVCEQEEWDAMEKAQPGYHVLIQSGIRNEAEAEKLARTNGDESQGKPAADRKAPRR